MGCVYLETPSKCQTRIRPEKWDAQNSLGFRDTNRSPNLSQTTRFSDSQQQQQKRTCRIVDFAVPNDHRMKLKERKKKDKYLDLAREMKKLWTMKVTVTLIVFGALGTITKGLIKRLMDLEIRGWVETIQMTALLRSARILRGLLVIWEDLQSLNLQ